MEQTTPRAARRRAHGERCSGPTHSAATVSSASCVACGRRRFRRRSRRPRVCQPSPASPLSGRLLRCRLSPPHPIRMRIPTLALATLLAGDTADAPAAARAPLAPPPPRRRAPAARLRGWTRAAGGHGGVRGGDPGLLDVDPARRFATWAPANSWRSRRWRRSSRGRCACSRSTGRGARRVEHAADPRAADALLINDMSVIKGGGRLEANEPQLVDHYLGGPPPQLGENSRASAPA